MGAAAHARSGPSTVSWLPVAGWGCLQLRVRAGTLQGGVCSGRRAGACLSALALSVASLCCFCA